MPCRDGDDGGFSRRIVYLKLWVKCWRVSWAVGVFLRLLYRDCTRLVRRNRYNLVPPSTTQHSTPSQSTVTTSSSVEYPDRIRSQSHVTTNTPQTHHITPHHILSHLISSSTIPINTTHGRAAIRRHISPTSQLLYPTRQKHIQCSTAYFCNSIIF